MDRRAELMLLPRSRWKLAITTMLLVILSGSGCRNSGPARFVVSGTVTIDGKALSSGTATFVPEDRSLRSEMAKIVRGQFNLRAGAGTYRVKIEATEVDPTRRTPEGGPIYRSVVPARYNVDTELRVVVSATEPNDFEFALRK